MSFQRRVGEEMLQNTHVGNKNNATARVSRSLLKHVAHKGTCPALCFRRKQQITAARITSVDFADGGAQKGTLIHAGHGPPEETTTKCRQGESNWPSSVDNDAFAALPIRLVTQSKLLGKMVASSLYVEVAVLHIINFVKTGWAPDLRVKNIQLKSVFLNVTVGGPKRLGNF